MWVHVMGDARLPAGTIAHPHPSSNLLTCGQIQEAPVFLEDSNGLAFFPNDLSDIDAVDRRSCAVGMRRAGDRHDGHSTEESRTHGQ